MQTLDKRARPKASLGPAVLKRRAELNLSQEEVAKRAGLHRTYVSDIERDARNISVASLIQLASALELEAWELLRIATTGNGGEQ
jgi:transcriptional regulator with XRE-family HTH domain